jgi:hypothetical protein
MGKVGVVFSYQSIQPPLQIATSRRVGILLNTEASRSMLHKHGTEPFIDSGLCQTGSNLIGDLIQPLTSGGNPEFVNHSSSSSAREHFHPAHAITTTIFSASPPESIQENMTNSLLQWPKCKPVTTRIKKKPVFCEEKRTFRHWSLVFFSNAMENLRG